MSVITGWTDSYKVSTEKPEPVTVTDQSGQKRALDVAIYGTATIIESSLTYSVSTVSVNSASSTVVLAANSDRRIARIYPLVYTFAFWINYGAAAAPNTTIPCPAGTRYFNVDRTTQSVELYQASGSAQTFIIEDGVVA